MHPCGEFVQVLPLRNDACARVQYISGPQSPQRPSDCVCMQEA